MKPAKYEKTIPGIPKESDLVRMSYDEISKIVDKLVQTQDEEGFLIKRNAVETKFQLFDLDFKGRDKRGSR